MEDWPIIIELLASHDDNLKKVESLAQREIFSIEVPVFNGLRDILPFSILTALRRMDYWFGKVPTIEHALCLVVLTDYVSCTYNQRSFYRTFENALTAKFVDSLFEKLYDEWRRVFSGRPLIHFTDSELESIRKSLSRSVDRFPESFRHKFLLNHIIKLGEKYRRLLSIENLGNVNVNLPKIQHPLVSSENFLWKDKYKDNSKNLANAGQKKKSNADMTKYVVKKPVYKVSLGNVPVHKESTKNIPMVTKKPVTDSSAASHTDGQARVSLEKLMKKNESEDDSMDSVDIYLTRRTIYSPVANYSRDSGDMHCETVPKSLSPVNSFFEEMEQLNECSSGVSDSDEEKMKVNYDSNYSEISVEEKSCMNWYDTAQTVEGKMKVNCDPNSKTNKVKMDENSEYSALTLSDEEKFDNGEKKLVNNDYLPKIVPKEDTKVSCDLPKTVTDEEKMNVANNNFSPTSAVAHKELVVSLYDCCTTKTNHTSVVPVPMVSAKPKLNAFDILMRKVIPPKRKRFF